MTSATLNPRLARATASSLSRAAPKSRVSTVARSVRKTTIDGNNAAIIVTGVCIATIDIDISADPRGSAALSAGNRNSTTSASRSTSTAGNIYGATRIRSAAAATEYACRSAGTAISSTTRYRRHTGGSSISARTAGQ
ncbi:MAG: hypothetical protein GTO04_01625 [Planctomycetales bacterium]|nr:hypothetical protein [Planctomycetales bacterium]